MDYSNPNHPKVVTKNVSTNFGKLFEDINASDCIEFEEHNFSLSFVPP